MISKNIFKKWEKNKKSNKKYLYPQKSPLFFSPFNRMQEN